MEKTDHGHKLGSKGEMDKSFHRYFPPVFIIEHTWRNSKY